MIRSALMLLRLPKYTGNLRVRSVHTGSTGGRPPWLLASASAASLLIPIGAATFYFDRYYADGDRKIYTGGYLSDEHWRTIAGLSPDDVEAVFIETITSGHRHIKTRGKDIHAYSELSYEVAVNLYGAELLDRFESVQHNDSRLNDAELIPGALLEDLATSECERPFHTFLRTSASNDGFFILVEEEQFRQDAIMSKIPTRPRDAHRVQADKERLLHQRAMAKQRWENIARQTE